MLIIYDNVDLDSNKNSWPAYIDVGLTRKRHLWDAAVVKSIFLIQLSKNTLREYSAYCNTSELWTNRWNRQTVCSTSRIKATFLGPI